MDTIYFDHFSMAATNLTQMCRLVMDIFQDLLKDLLWKASGLSAVFTRLNFYKLPNLLSPKDPDFHDSVQDLDKHVQFIWPMERNLTNRTPWDNIIRLCEQRNVFAHEHKGLFSETDFQDMWKIIHLSDTELNTVAFTDTLIIEYLLWSRKYNGNAKEKQRSELHKLKTRILRCKSVLRVSSKNSNYEVRLLQKSMKKITDSKRKVLQTDSKEENIVTKSRKRETKMMDFRPKVHPGSQNDSKQENLVTRSRKRETKMMDFTPKVHPGSQNDSKQQSLPVRSRPTCLGVMRILAMTILVEFLNAVFKIHSKEEKVEEKHCHDSDMVEVKLSNKSDLVPTSKLYSLMSDTIAKMSEKKGLKKFVSSMDVNPETSVDIYPVFGPGVGPAIDQLLSCTSPPARQELMANESLRLCTFHNFPAFRMVSTVLLAKAGFFYSGHNDEVTCYSCDKSIADWNIGLDPYKVHKENSPDCEHIRVMDAQHASMAAVAAAAATAAAALATQNNTTGEAATKSSMTGTETKADNASSKTAAAAAAESTSVNTLASIKSSADTGYNTQTTGSDQVAEKAGPNTQTTGSDLAQTAGYKFGGPAPKDNTTPEASHLNDSIRTSADSDRNFSSLSSINCSLSHSSLTNSSGIQDTSTPANNYPTQPSESSAPVATLAAGYKGPANPQRTRAYYPDYVLKEDRLKTFNNWPTRVHQTPQQMVESGFFYAGYEDCVRCFQCGIGLRNWEMPDNPHVEHARWSPRCPYLLQVKGTDFINLVMDAVAQLERRKNNPTTNQTARETTTQSSNNNTVVTTSENRQNSSSASGSSMDNAGPSITPSGTPADRQKPTPADTLNPAPADTPNPAPADTPNPTQAERATPTPADTPTPTPVKPPMDTTPTASKPTPPSSQSIAAIEKDLKKTETASMKQSLTVDNVSKTKVNTGSDKAKDLADLMKTEVVKKLKQDGYGEDSVKAAIRMLLDTKDLTDITETIISDMVKKNTSVRKRRTALGGDAAEEPLSEELQRIKRENREMRERTVCKICLEDQVSIAFIPCGHLVACGQCAHAITRCAVCRKPITNKILTHMNV